MEPDELSRIEGVLGKRIGPAGRWYLYPRDRNTPTSAVLREAEKDLGPIANYWLDQTPADVYCLTGFSEVIAVLSPRYVELWADIRALSMNTIFSPDLKPALAERLALKIIAESSLLLNDPVVAVSAILRAAMTCNGIVIVPNTVQTLQQEPLDSPYMACWFFGLCHELGHLMEPRRGEAVARVYPDEYFVGLLEAILKSYPGMEGSISQAVAEARSGSSESDLNPKKFRSEAIADIFAGVCLLNVTSDIVAQEKQAAPDPTTVRDFNVFSTAYEMFLSVFVHDFMDRCRRKAANDFERSMQSVTVQVRLNMLRNHFSGALTAYVFGPNANPDQRAQVDQILENSLNDLATLTSPIERAFSKAIAFTLDDQRPPNMDAAFEDWKTWSATQPASILTQAQAELRSFCTRATSWGLEGPEVTRLSQAIGDLIPPSP